MFTVFLLLVAAAAAALALPTGQLDARATSPWCSGLGPGAFDSAENFTLAAYNTTLPNANATGAPLVLGQAGAVDGAEFEVLSTWATYSYNDWPTLSLSAGALIPNSQYGARTTDANVTSGSPIVFVTSVDAPAPVQIYCAVADIDPTGGGEYPLLSLNGDTDGFALCLNEIGAYEQNNIIWQPTPNNGGEYVYDTCYPVNIQILGLNN